jgi:hypothetical protein
VQPAQRVRVLAILLWLTTSAAADRATIVDGELLRGVDHNEILLGTRLAMLGVDVETARFDFVDFRGGDSFDLRGYFLGWAYRIDRPRWGATIGAHLVTSWSDSYRYLTPWLGARFGDATRLTLELRSAGMFAGSVDETPGRSMMRDFDLTTRLGTPAFGGRIELRGRYRDIDTGALHVRDAFVGAGFELAVTRGARRWAPAFVGVGVRQERWRDERITDVVERVVTGPTRASWQMLVWIEVDLGVTGAFD